MLVFKQLFAFFKVCCSIELGLSQTLALVANVITFFTAVSYAFSL